MCACFQYFREPCIQIESNNVPVNQELVIRQLEQQLRQQQAKSRPGVTKEERFLQADVTEHFPLGRPDTQAGRLDVPPPSDQRDLPAPPPPPPMNVPGRTLQQHDNYPPPPATSAPPHRELHSYQEREDYIPPPPPQNEWGHHRQLPLPHDDRAHPYPPDIPRGRPGGPSFYPPERRSPSPPHMRRERFHSPPHSRRGRSPSPPSRRYSTI